MCVALHSLLGGEIHPLGRNATLIALLLGQLVDEPMNRTVDGARSDATRNVAFQIQVAGRRPVEGGSAVRRSDPRTARASLARRSWASQRINPGTRRAPSSIVSSARTWKEVGGPAVLLAAPVSTRVPTAKKMVVVVLILDPFVAAAGAIGR